MAGLAPLPIDPLVDDLVARAWTDRGLALVAEPGAGKTTRLPPALVRALDGEVLVAEPRRLAARLAARRVASELGEAPGETVGYEVRFESCAGPRTRLRYVTEGVLGRRLVGDRRLEGVAAVVLDEFHERRLDGDVALAVLNRLRRTTRPDLVVVVMSATLEAEPVARFLGCEVVRARGAPFPVEIEHAARPDDRPLERRVASAVRRVVDRGLEGDVLVFLPGAAEIRRARQACEPLAARAGFDLAVLHGDLPAEAQDRAVALGPRRKVILSTNVAETSVTVEGVRAVVDSGLARVRVHSPWSGFGRLETRPASRSSTAQRAGRAGRTGPGLCVRLFTKEDDDARPEGEAPEIRRVDLAGAALALRAAGLRMPSEPTGKTGPSIRTEGPWPRGAEMERRTAVAWDERRDGPGQSRGMRPDAFPASSEALELLEPPPVAALAAAEALLARLGAIDREGALTDLGRAMADLPLHPRLGRLCLEARARGAPRRGALLAALLAERELRLAARARFDGGAPELDEDGPSDLLARLEAFEAAERDGLTAAALRAHGLDPAATRAVSRARDQLARVLGLDGPPQRRGGARALGHAERAAGQVADQALGPAMAAASPDGAARRRSARRPVRTAAEAEDDEALGLAALAAFPDRVARRRRPRGEELVLSGGGSARLSRRSVVKAAELLVAVEADEVGRGLAVVTAASAIEPEWLVELFPERVEERRELRFDEAAARVERVERVSYDGLVLEERRSRPDPADPEVGRALAEAALAAGPSAFCDGEALARLERRVAFAAAAGGRLPSTLDGEVVRRALAALCEGRSSFAEVSAASLLDALRASLGPGLADLDRLAPTHVAIPGRPRVEVAYEADRPPHIASRLQDFFGAAEGPRVAAGAVPLVLHLLAPNGRAVQVTTDLAGFWERHYPAVRRELMRRYPRHGWPEDPLSSPPTRPGRRRP